MVLVADAGEEILRAGDAAGFPVNEGNGHCLQNRSAADFELVEIGTRIAADAGYYGDIDMIAPAGGSRQCTPAVTARLTLTCSSTLRTTSTPTRGRRGSAADFGRMWASKRGWLALLFLWPTIKLEPLIFGDVLFGICLGHGAEALRLLTVRIAKWPRPIRR